MLPETIATHRILLRPFGPQDMTAHVAIRSRWEVTRWLSTNIPFPYTRTDGKNFIEQAMSQFADGRSVRYALTDRESGRHMGGIRVFSLTRETEVGYWLHPDFWGRGFGTELLTAVIGAGFATGVIRCFVAQTAADNMASRRILEKVGFKYEGAVPEPYARGGHCDGCSEFYRLKIKE